jgi:hypothetical protein
MALFLLIMWDLFMLILLLDVGFRSNRMLSGKEKVTRRTFAPIIIYSLLFIVSVVYTVHFHNDYASHYKILQAAEVKSITTSLKQAPISVQDQGVDSQFSNLRDVLVLPREGFEEDYYYNPTTGKAIYNGTVM